MSLIDLLKTSSPNEPLYSNDVFSTYLYTGNASTQTITNGIDLAGKGGLVWTKSRSNATAHVLTDSARGLTNPFYTIATDPQTSGITTMITSFNSNGFSLGNDSQLDRVNVVSNTYASWTFRKAAKFFDVVTYTGTGSARTIAHSLGVAPAMMMVKRTDTTGDWITYQISRGASSALNYLVLNTTAGSSGSSTIWNNTLPTSSVFTVGTDANVNASGGTYVAYLFAQDTSSTGIIQSGIYDGTGTTATTITLGWEPQFILIKRIDTVGNWYMFDSMRGLTVLGSPDGMLQPNTSVAETTGTDYVATFATGFNVTSTSGELNSGIGTYIYMAIRRPNKPPTTGTQVYLPKTRTGTGAAATVTGVGFAPDMLISENKSSPEGWMANRLAGFSNTAASYLFTPYSSAETAVTSATSGVMLDGATTGTVSLTAGANLNSSGQLYVDWFFKRAPGFMDVVCYTGTGITHTETHNLTVAPELTIFKNRNTATGWTVYYGSSLFLRLNETTQGLTDGTILPTSTSITVNAGLGNGINASGSPYVAYLFATLAGISKVGSYTGNGTTQNIECGFAAGARFILIKCTSTTGNWYVWDSARGIVSANDPHLSLNTTAAEVTTDDSVDPYSAGFAVNQVAATNINVSSATYIFLAIA